MFSIKSKIVCIGDLNEHPNSPMTIFTKFINLCYFYLLEKQQRRGIPLQYCCLEDPVDGGAWWTAFHGITKSWTQLSDFIFTLHFHALEKKTATHSSVLAWKIPGMEEPGGLPSMGSHRVGHDWSNLAAAAAAQKHRLASNCVIICDRIKNSLCLQACLPLFYRHLLFGIKVCQ